MERRPVVKGPGVPGSLVVRPMRLADVDAVVQIETEAFSSPWKRETFAGLIGRPGVELLVMAEQGDDVLGYAVLWCILDQGELANVAVTPDRRGRGLGSQLLRGVLDVAKERGVRQIFLEVRTSNTRAVDLYRRFGFADVGVRRDYYDSPREDARVMMLELV
jgi:ribosomal-protein-alanine N-acetyltransferase